MSFEKVRLGTVIASVLLTVPVLSAAPAQALSIRNQLAFGGTVTRSVSGTNSFYDFLQDGSSADVGTAGDLDLGGAAAQTGIFAGVMEAAGGIKIRDLGTIASSGYSAAPITGFITGIKLSGGTVVSFNLDTYAESAFPNPFAGGILTGFFTNGLGKTVAKGSFAGQFNDIQATGTNTFSGTLVANEVPTPALLPGLVGMGVAALRKRKSEELETEEA